MRYSTRLIEHGTLEAREKSLAASSRERVLPDGMPGRDRLLGSRGLARLAMMQDLNPFLWGLLAVVVYTGAPLFMIWHGATWMDAAWVWGSSFGGLFVLLIVQSIVAAIRRTGTARSGQGDDGVAVVSG